MKYVWTILVVLLVASSTAVADTTIAGGLMFSGKAVSYTVGSSVQLVQCPAIYADLLYSPEAGEMALGLSAPVRVALDPLADLCDFEWAPWAEAALDRVAVGVAAWRTQDEFPVRGGLYFKVTALEWGF